MDQTPAVNRYLENLLYYILNCIRDGLPIETETILEYNMNTEEILEYRFALVFLDLVEQIIDNYYSILNWIYFHQFINYRDLLNTTFNFQPIPINIINITHQSRYDISFINISADILLENNNINILANIPLENNNINTSADIPPLENNNINTLSDIPPLENEIINTSSDIPNLLENEVINEYEGIPPIVFV